MDEAALDMDTGLFTFTGRGAVTHSAALYPLAPVQYFAWKGVRGICRMNSQKQTAEPVGHMLL